MAGRAVQRLRAQQAEVPEGHGAAQPRAPAEPALWRDRVPADPARRRGPTKAPTHPGGTACKQWCNAHNDAHIPAEVWATRCDPSWAQGKCAACPECASRAGATEGPAGQQQLQQQSAPSTAPNDDRCAGLQHGGEPCWDQCVAVWGHKRWSGGFCRWCGVAQLCCRKGRAQSIKQGCDGLIGGDAGFICACRHW
eukprot:gene3841-1725_t